MATLLALPRQWKFPVCAARVPRMDAGVPVRRWRRIGTKVRLAGRQRSGTTCGTPSFRGSASGLVPRNEAAGCECVTDVGTEVGADAGLTDVGRSGSASMEASTQRAGMPRGKPEANTRPVLASGGYVLVANQDKHTRRAPRARRETLQRFRALHRQARVRAETYRDRAVPVLFGGASAELNAGTRTYDGCRSDGCWYGCRFDGCRADAAPASMDASILGAGWPGWDDERVTRDLLGERDQILATAGDQRSPRKASEPCPRSGQASPQAPLVAAPQE